MRIAITTPNAAISNEQLAEALANDPRARAMLARRKAPPPPVVVPDRALARRVKALEQGPPRSNSEPPPVERLYRIVDALKQRGCAVKDIRRTVYRVASTFDLDEVSPTKREEVWKALRRLVDVTTPKPDLDMDFN